MSKPKLLFLKGLPASGKTTYANELVDAGKWKRVNKDDLRAMLDGGKWSHDNEDYVNHIQKDIVIDALGYGTNVIVDNTHLSPGHEERYRELAKQCNAEFHVKFFNVPVDECIKRDIKRDNPVGKKVIQDMYDKYLKPAPAVYTPPAHKPDAIICDIDGTIAHMNGRSPYDESKVLEDTVDETILDIIRTYHKHDPMDEEGVNIIFVSGRHDSCEEDTSKWLYKYDIPCDALFMRKTGDDRKDYIVKREIFDEHIRDNYNVLFVLDDRDRVVSMWRNELGLKCLQVAEGNF